MLSALLRGCARLRAKKKREKGEEVKVKGVSCCAGSKDRRKGGDSNLRGKIDSVKGRGKKRGGTV